MMVSNQVSGEDASAAYGPVGCTLEAEGLHLGSFCAALFECVMLLKHISAGNPDGSPPSASSHLIVWDSSIACSATADWDTLPDVKALLCSLSWCSSVLPVCTNVDLGACSTGDPVHNISSVLWWHRVSDSDQCLVQSTVWLGAGLDP